MFIWWGQIIPCGNIWSNPYWFTEQFHWLCFFFWGGVIFLPCISIYHMPVAWFHGGHIVMSFYLFMVRFWSVNILVHLSPHKYPSDNNAPDFSVGNTWYILDLSVIYGKRNSVVCIEIMCKPPDNIVVMPCLCWAQFYSGVASILVLIFDPVY